MLKLKDIKNGIIKEETSNNPLTVNVGGVRFKIQRNGSVKRLGSEEMDYGSAKCVGAVNEYGRGNRQFTKNDIDIPLKDIFDNPNILVGKYLLLLMDGRLILLSGGKGSQESDHRVIWSMIH